MAKEMKSYKIYWLDEEGNFTLLETGVSSDLKNELFNMICKMLATAPNIFRMEGNDNIRKMIRPGNAGFERERYHAFIGGQTLSIFADLPIE